MDEGERSSVVSEREAARRTIQSLLIRIGTNFNMLWDNLSELSTRYDKSKETANTLRDIKGENFTGALSPKAKATVKLFAYLGLIEGLGTTLMDMALWLLIANRNEMHINRGGGIMHVMTLKQLARLKLSYKIEFLKAHKLSFFAGPIDSNLRNDIAHLKFTIDHLGIIKDSNGHVRDIDAILSDFWLKVDSITSIFDETRLLQLLGEGNRQING